VMVSTATPRGGDVDTPPRRSRSAIVAVVT
jgi:hypothetical protein